MLIETTKVQVNSLPQPEINETLTLLDFLLKYIALSESWSTPVVEAIKILIGCSFNTSQYCNLVSVWIVGMNCHSFDLKLGPE